MGVHPKSDTHSVTFHMCTVDMMDESSESVHRHNSALESELDLSIVRYSRVCEDYRVLSRALQIGPEDVVLSITRYFLAHWLAGLEVQSVVY